jgi:hypothetical protein
MDGWMDGWMDDKLQTPHAATNCLPIITKVVLMMYRYYLIQAAQQNAEHQN